MFLAKMVMKVNVILKLVIFKIIKLFYLEILIEDVGTSPCEIGSVIRSYNFQTNIDVMVI